MAENTPRSPTLESMKILPESVCAGCQNSVWFIEHLEKEKKDNLKVFCLLMHAVITNPMKACDGTEISQAQTNAS